MLKQEGYCPAATVFGRQIVAFPVQIRARRKILKKGSTSANLCSAEASVLYRERKSPVFGVNMLEYGWQSDFYLPAADTITIMLCRFRRTEVVQN